MGENLCLACGICCDGTLFKDVKLRSADEPARLKKAGLPVTISPAALRPPRLRQPCAALGPDCRCRIYSQRPNYCRQFECALRRRASAGEIDLPAALGVVRSTRRRADRVRRLLYDLGEKNVTDALSQRFRRVARHIYEGAPDEQTADLFGKLSREFHQLNVMLSETFYPGR